MNTQLKLKWGGLMNASLCKLFQPVMVAIVFQLIFSGFAAAQNQVRAVRGTVKDEKGQPIQDATCEIYRQDGSYRKQGKSNAKGECNFILGQDNPGTYYFGVRKEGYESKWQPNVRPEIDQPPPVVDLKLVPGKSDDFAWNWSQDKLITERRKIDRAKGMMKARGQVKKLYDEAIVKYHENKYGEAIQKLVTATTLSPKEPYIWYYLAFCKMKQELYEEALANFMKASECDPTNPEFISRQAEILFRLDKKEESVETFEKASQLAEKEAAGGDKDSRTNGARSFTNICIILTTSDTGKYEKGIEACKRAIALDPKFPEAHYYLGLGLTRNEETACDASKEMKAFLEFKDTDQDLQKMAREIILKVEPSCQK
jgi:TolA-binding protein